MDFKAQHELTAARERAQHAWLHQEMHRCISEDPLDRRGRWARAFFCADRFSRQFLTAMPLRDTDSVFCNAEWDEAIACYMGLVSPACKGHAARGVVLDVSGAPGLDPYGEVLFTHVGVVNKAGARTEWHNGLKNAIFQTTRLAGIPVEDETLIRVLGDGILDDAKRQQVVDTIVSAPTRAEVEARRTMAGGERPCCRHPPRWHGRPASSGGDRQARRKAPASELIIVGQPTNGMSLRSVPGSTISVWLLLRSTHAEQARPKAKFCPGQVAERTQSIRQKRRKTRVASKKRHL